MERSQLKTETLIKCLYGCMYALLVEQENSVEKQKNNRPEADSYTEHLKTILTGMYTIVMIAIDPEEEK